MERITNKTPEGVQEIMAALTKLEDKNAQNIRDCLKSCGADYIPIIVGAAEIPVCRSLMTLRLTWLKKR